MSGPPDKLVVIDLFREGVAAIETISDRFPGEAWGRPACGTWTAAETVRHVRSVAGWYHEWLDRAMEGEASPPFPAIELDTRNAETVASLANLTPAAAMTAFRKDAYRYLERIDDEWDRPYGFPFGTATVGLHCGVAAAEWHLHADDLSRLTTSRHQPSRPGDLFLAAALGLAAAEGGLKGRVQRSLAPLAARRDPWASMLRRSGRLD